MRLLIDECLPRALKRLLPEHTCCTVQEMAWAGIKNGALLSLAEAEFDALITIDQGFAYQQDLKEAQNRNSPAESGSDNATPSRIKIGATNRRNSGRLQRKNNAEFSECFTGSRKSFIIKGRGSSVVEQPIRNRSCAQRNKTFPNFA